jgi:NAD(P)-dependent dehydrogenase (short-subunit alcohol dehydrogenase family)
VHGKTVVVTGANSGIGFVTARDLAQAGARVLMVCRHEGRGERARAEIASQASGQLPELLLADMGLQADVRALAEQLHRRSPRIDVLINNAASIFGKRELTKDGIERTFALNHLGPFLLTNLVLDLLHAAPQSRIVNVAAESPLSRLDFDNLQAERSYNFLGAYFRSKLENIIFTFELDRRLKGTRVTANCMSPGPTRTRFGHNLRGPVRFFPLIVKRLFPGAETGARTLTWLARAPELAAKSGDFYFRERARKTRPFMRDPLIAARLWQISSALVGLDETGETPVRADIQQPVARSAS